MQVKASLSSSTSGTSGAQVGGNTAAEAFKLPAYLLPLLIVAVFVFGVVWVIRR